MRFYMRQQLPGIEPSALASIRTMGDASTRPLIPSWSPTPIPSLSLSAGGLLALADLNTVAQRTVIAGGSSWLDALVLAPGLHYQQAAHALDDAAPVSLAVNNPAVVAFLRRLWQEAGDRATGTLTLDVALPRDGGAKRDAERLARRLSGLVRRRRSADLHRQAVAVDWLSHAFYLASPLLTSAAVAFMVLLADWWGLAFILALMVSRILNIWSIKQRSRPGPPPPGAPAAPRAPNDRPAEYAVDLGSGRRAVLRGLSSDLDAVTSLTWLRAKTTVDGYLEAAAKLLVYLVAAFSGNLSQAGAIVLMALLLVSAGLLGLSNSHARGLKLNGRVARLQIDDALRHRRVAPPQPADREAGIVGGRPVDDLGCQ